MVASYSAEVAVAMPMLLALLGCGPREQVVWDSVGAGDAVEDVAVAMILFGKVESDREEIEGPHVAGGSLTLNATRYGYDDEGWSAATLEPDIAEVVSATQTGSGLRLELAFHRQGTTWLHVFDGDGFVIDQQRLAVRDPERAELVAWDDLSIGVADPIEGPLDVVAGSDLSVAVTWADATGTPLDGGGLLVVSAPDAPLGVTADANFTGVVDTLDLSVPRDAGIAGFDVELAALDVAVESRLVVLHERSEVDAVELETVVLGSDDELQQRSGAVLARPRVGGVRMLGARVRWTFGDGPALQGSVLLWDEAAGPATDVTACFDDVCEAVTTPGTPTGVVDADAPYASGCGCASGSAGGSWLVVAAVVGMIRRWGQGSASAGTSSCAASGGAAPQRSGTPC